MAAVGVAAGKKAKRVQSLEDYQRAQRLEAVRKVCKICALPDAVRAEVRTGREKRIQLQVIRGWLEREHRVKVTTEDFTVHANGRHDERY